MSVVGFDIGNSNCYVAIARAGGIETVANEYSDRCTPAIVAFNNLQRLVGTSAKNQMVSNYKSTVSQVKRLIGRKYDEPSMKNEFDQLPYECVRMDNGEIGIKVNYRGESKCFLPEQIMAGVLTYLKEIAETNLNSKVTNCVISVPSFYTDYQRRALLSASKIAGLSCLKVMNETSAVALNYGLFKQDVPPPEEKPRHVAFIDVGNSSLQVCIAAFNKGKIKILSTCWDDSLGGRDFDHRLKLYFAEAFLEKYKVDARTNKRAWIRLGTEVEKLKKQIGTISTDLTLAIECFMEDIDVKHSINRACFEEICQDLFSRVESPLLQAISESGLKVEEIDVMEIVGGSSRIPALKSILEKVFNKPCSTTLNQDEAVARGCAIQCAMLSHTVKVRDIEVLDAAPYPIHISWDCTKNEEQRGGDMEVFKKHHAYPFTKLLTFPHRVEPFCFRAYYDSQVKIPHLSREIGEFVVNALPPSESSEKVKVKVKVRLDENGCFAVSSASMVETLPPPPVENGDVMETSDSTAANENVVDKPQEAQNENMDLSSETKDSSVNGEESHDTKNEKPTQGKEEAMDTKKEAVDSKKAEPKKAKKSTKSTELVVDKKQVARSIADMNLLVEIENELISQVRVEKERADAKNSVEEYVYMMREKIFDEYEKYILEDDRDQFSALLSKTEDWLYEDGENEIKSVYVAKLAELKKIGQPISDRYNSRMSIPAAFEALGTSIMHYRKIFDLYVQKDEKYDHIEESEMKKVEKKIEETFLWFNEKSQGFGQCKLYENPKIHASEILNEKKAMEVFCDPIVSKPKPKVEPPKEEEAKDQPKTEKANSEPTADPMETDQKDATATDEVKKNLDMEVD